MRVCGIPSPSAFAVLRLMTSAKVLGCSTGRSAGFAPWVATALGWHLKDCKANIAKVHRCANRLKIGGYVKEGCGNLELSDKGQADAIRVKRNRDLAGSRFG
jgi:hypothetical protein